MRDVQPPATSHQPPATSHQPLKTLAVVAALLLTSCSSGSAQSAKRPAPADVVATVGSAAITLAEVDDKALGQPVSSFGSVTLAQALYDARRGALDEMVATKLIDEAAKAQGTDRASLVEKEVTDKIQTVTDADVAAWFQANESRVQGATLDQTRQQIRAFLTQERMHVVREQYVQSLKAKTPVRVQLDPPRQAVKMVSTSPTRGRPGAPIEMIEFSDFQCPFCQRAGTALTQVFAAYGDQIHFVYREYPLPSHQNARPAAEAGQCANEQGQFWPYHDRLFANQQRLSAADLKQHAADLRLDAARFAACLDSHKYATLIDAEIKAGNDAGVNGTPAFFINGRVLSGAQPFTAFKRIIDDELELKKK